MLFVMFLPKYITVLIRRSYKLSPLHASYCGSIYQHSFGEQGERGRVGAQTDVVLSRSVRRKREPPLRAVLTGQDHLGGRKEGRKEGRQTDRHRERERETHTHIGLIYINIIYILR